MRFGSKSARQGRWLAFLSSLWMACGDDRPSPPELDADASGDGAIAADGDELDVSPADTAQDSADAQPDTGSNDARPDAEVGCDGPPGLYEEGSCTTLREGVRRFAPQYV